MEPELLSRSLSTLLQTPNSLEEEGVEGARRAPPSNTLLQKTDSGSISDP